MKEVYRSKLGIIVIAVLLFGFIPLCSSIYSHDILSIAITSLVIGFITYILATTNYSIDNTTLIIKVGFLYKVSIDINSIERIENTGILSSAPALSLTDRIIVTYNGGNTIILSPKGREDFCEKLKQINPKITIQI